MTEIAIIGAGPYGLSLAAYIRSLGIPFRIFGRPMDTWVAHMPKGMFLKSDGFASNIYDPEGKFTLRAFCAEQKTPYSDTGTAVRLDTFSAYGLAFKDRIVPELEDTLVTSLERVPDGFFLRLANGDTLTARRVVLAVGVTHFQHIPSNLKHLPAGFLSHSFDHHRLESFRGRKVVLIGGGASALDLAGLLHQADVDVHLFARQKSLKFHNAPNGKPRSLWERIRRPQSGLGPSLRSRFFTDAPLLIHCLRENTRLKMVRTQLGPCGGWFTKEMVIGRVPVRLGMTPECALVDRGRVRLRLRAREGTALEVPADHLIAATGYKVDIGRLTFLSDELRAEVRTVDNTPILSSVFESSVPGLYFVGLAAANSFGPLMRFAYGARFTARRLSRTLAKSLSRGRAFVSAPLGTNAIEMQPACQVEELDRGARTGD